MRRNIHATKCPFTELYYHTMRLNSTFSGMQTYFLSKFFENPSKYLSQYSNVFLYINLVMQILMYVNII